MSRLTVVHISTNDMDGGAARAANRLHEAFEKDSQEVTSCMFVRNKQSARDSVRELQPDNSLTAQIRRAARYAYIQSDFFPRYVWDPRSFGVMSDDRTRFAGELVGQLPSADLVHFHYVTGFIDISAFFESYDGPIVWTLHDMNPFTGGCHYSFGCDRFKQRCGACPHLDSTREDDPSRRAWERKQKALREKISNEKLHVVAPSKWLARQASQSSLLGESKIHHIPHGLDHRLFRPRGEELSRADFGFLESEKLVLFVAHSSSDPRKGFEYLAEALANVELHNTTVVSVGGGDPDIPGDLSHVHIGYVDDDRRLSALYSMVDLFVIPSIQEAFGQTALESMACGTPVVGFDTGGIPDMIRPGDTGWLAETGNTRSLGHALETAIENDHERQKRGKRCRTVVEKEYTLENQAEQYTTLYRSVLQ